MKSFLKDDFCDALRGVFVGAVTWLAHPEASDERGVRGLAMYGCLLQARALYEFFYKSRSGSAPPTVGGDARANDFSPSWTANDAEGLYRDYMGDGSPVQKRLFHLVYGREQYSGGTATDESDHIKNQVEAVAKDLHRLAREFIPTLTGELRVGADEALQRARDTAAAVARAYNVADPLGS